MFGGCGIAGTLIVNKRTKRIKSNTWQTRLSCTKLTAEDARSFVDEAQQERAKLQIPQAQADWAYQTYINQDTAAVSAYLSENFRVEHHN